MQYKVKQSKDYYENNKLLRDRAKNKYRELSEEEKNIKREYGKSRYHSMFEEKKKRLKEYQISNINIKYQISNISNIFYVNKSVLQN